MENKKIHLHAWGRCQNSFPQAGGNCSLEATLHPLGKWRLEALPASIPWTQHTKWDLCWAVSQKWFRCIHVRPAVRALLGNEFQAGNCTETKMRWWSERSEWNSVGKSELTFHSSWLAAQEDKAELTLSGALWQFPVLRADLNFRLCLRLWFRTGKEKPPHRQGE